MQTATEKAIVDHAKATAERRLNIMIAEFTERYAPDDRADAGKFAADLHAIVREVYHDLQAPVTAALHSVLMAQQVPVAFFVPPSKDKSG